VRAPAVGEDAEGGGEEQLGEEEERGEDADDGGAYLGAAMGGEVGKVEDEQAAGEARAEPQREGAAQDTQQRRHEA
jgi:hypothetical protein